MVLESRHPTGDTGTGAVIGNMIIRTAQYLVADVSDVAATETYKTSEAAVGEGAMVQTPTPPIMTDRKLGAAVRTNENEVGRRRRDYRLMGMGTSVGKAIGAHRRRWGQPFNTHRRRWGQPSGAHRTLVRPAIAALTVRSAIGAHKILVRHAMRCSQ